MKGWSARLGGDKLDALTRVSGADDWAIVADGDDYYLTSRLFAPDADFTEVRAIAGQLVERIEQAAFLHSSTRHGLNINSMARTGDDGKRHHFIEARANFVIEGFLSAAAIVVGPDGDLVPPPPPPPSPIAVTGSLLTKRSDLAEAVQLYFAKHDDWTQLCNVIHMVRDAIHGDIPDSWTPRKQVELLERTAQGRSTAGDTARHLRPPGTKGPENPMLLGEAQHIVRRILIEWQQSIVDAEGDKKDPTA